ncbi:MULTISPECIES: helix-turn-helix domain-containing protein [Leptospira]|uniref:helix-turn-helix domain-containing protein n=1 Tax=Leptospira TaxID=171 RepID=UPI0002BFD457|nr:MULTISPECIES: helix-turn-helix domain-containing protein [Leptospira]EMK12868.1 helix-turn-helix domain of resolvase [Leptospira sp. serovar Kenya str. Sh9]
MRKWLPHGLVLTLLSLAEGSRLFEFYQTLSGNMLAGIASAAITVGVVFYLAFYGYRWASVGATILCVALSFASFVDPLREEYAREEKSHPAQELLKYPTYNPRAYWNGGKEAYVETFRLETELVKRENERITTENAGIQTKRKLSLYFWHLLLGAVVLAVCVPILNFLVSHKIAEVHLDALKSNLNPIQSRSESAWSFEVMDLAQPQSHPFAGISSGPAESPRKTVSHEAVAQDNKGIGDKKETGDSLQNGDKATIVSHGNSRMEDKGDSDNLSRRSDDTMGRDAEILQRFQSKISAPTIAKEFGISRQHVYKIVKKAQKIFEIPTELRFA